MTRVEKYRQYREEISNMKFETFTQKGEVAKQIGKMHSNKDSNKLNYDQVMIIQDELDSGDVDFKRKRFIGLTKYEIFYYSIALLFIVAIIVSLILVGIKLWG